MKKFTLLILTISFYMGVNAQNDSTNKNLNPPQSFNKSEAIITQHADGYMMKNGKMVSVKNGQVTPMERSITLTDGTVIMINGSYKKNGVTKMLKEGEQVDMMGEIIPMDNAKNLSTDPNYNSNSSVEPDHRSINSSENQNHKTKKNKDMILIPDSTRKKKAW